MAHHEAQPLMSPSLTFLTPTSKHRFVPPLISTAGTPRTTFGALLSTEQGLSRLKEHSVALFKFHGKQCTGNAMSVDHFHFGTILDQKMLRW